MYYTYLNEELTFTFVPKKVYKTNDIFFKPIHIKSDENSLVTQSYKSSNFILQEYRDVKEYFSINNTSKEYQISYLRRSPDTINMRREYQKFSAVMIQFGGLIKFIITLAGFFVTKYNSFLFTVELANKLYNFNFGNQKANKAQLENAESKKADSKKARSSIFKSNDPSPLKLKNKSIEMITLKQDQIQSNNNSQNTLPNQNGKSILNALCKKRNSQQKTSPKLTPRSLKNLEDITSPTLNNNISKVSKKESLEKIEEELSKQQIEVKVTLEQENKVNKEEPPLPIQHIAQKFQHHRKDSVRQLQMFQENIQNQYYNNIKKKKQSIFNNNVQIEEKKMSQSNNDLKKGQATNGLLHKDSILNPIIFQQSSNIIQNLVYFKEIGFKNKKDFLLEQFRVIINRSKKITVKLWYFLRLLTCGKCFNTEENFLIEKAREYAQKDLDIYIILDKLQEIEKIKKILLDENQLTIFNFSQKPLIQKNDHFYNTLSLRNLQIKHRKSETFASKAKVNTSTHNLMNQQKTLFCQKLQYDNIEAYEKLHKAYENIQPFHIQDKVSRCLVRELGTELREIFELSKLIDQQNDNTPKSTPMRNASKTQYDQHDSRHLDDLDLNHNKKQQNKSRNSIHICDGVYGSVSKQPSRTLYANECLSPEENPVDENSSPSQIKNPYTFTSSSTNKPARLSIFKGLKGVLVQNQNEAIQENQSSSSESSSSQSSSGSSKKSRKISYTSHHIQQQINIKNIKFGQEEYLDSNISQSQHLQNDNHIEEIDFIKDDPYIDKKEEQVSPTFQPQQEKTEYDMSKSFKMNLAQISLNQTLFVQDIDMDMMNDSHCKAITETCLKESECQKKEFLNSPKNPIN